MDCLLTVLDRFVTQVDEASEQLQLMLRKETLESTPIPLHPRAVMDHLRSCFAVTLAELAFKRDVPPVSHIGPP